MVAIRNIARLIFARSDPGPKANTVFRLVVLRVRAANRQIPRHQQQLPPGRLDARRMAPGESPSAPTLDLQPGSQPTAAELVGPA